MAFNPTTWKDGDTLTADKLNGMMLNFSATDIQENAKLTQAEGALVLDVNGDLYQAQGGKAVLLGSFKGPKGDAGAKGDKGDDGAAGTAGKDGKDGDDAKQIKSGTINEDKNGALTGATLTFNDNTTLDLTVNKATA